MSPAPEPLRRVLAVAFAAVAVTAIGIAQEGAPDAAFGRTVLPLLSDRCYACHGPDAEARKAGAAWGRQWSLDRCARPGGAGVAGMMVALHGLRS